METEKVTKMKFLGEGLLEEQFEDALEKEEWLYRKALRHTRKIRKFLALRILLSMWINGHRRTTRR